MTRSSRRETANSITPSKADGPPRLILASGSPRRREALQALELEFTVRPVDLDEPIGRLTRMDSLQSQSLAQASRSGLEVKKRQILAALDLFARGEYGTCRRCEEPIGFRRLKVRPETPFCLPCQEALEEERG